MLIIAAALAAAGLAVVAFVPYGAVQLKSSVCLGTLAAAAFVCFKDRWPKKLFAIVLSFCSSLLAELILVLFLPQVAAYSEYIQNSVAMTVSVIAAEWTLTAFFLWIFSMLLRSAQFFPDGDWKLFFLVPASQCALLMLWFSRTTLQTSRAFTCILVLAAVLCLAADAGTYMLFLNAGESSALLARARTLEAELARQKADCAELTAQYGRVRVLRHDILNHVFSIQTMLDNGLNDEAERYAQELFDNYSELAGAARAAGEDKP